MKKAIAMKCNQEQWDSIKEKLVGYREKCCIDFRLFNYLVNNASNEFNVVCNYDQSCKTSYNREVHETWNEQIFLEACGIETEKIFKGIELLYRNNDTNNEWVNLGNSEYRIKPDYSKEIAELERQIQILKNK